MIIDMIRETAAYAHVSEWDYETMLNYTKDLRDEGDIWERIYQAFAKKDVCEIKKALSIYVIENNYNEKFIPMIYEYKWI